MRDARLLKDVEIASELKELGKAWGASRVDDEGHGGSPGEWVIERMTELETEQKRRALPVIGYRVKDSTGQYVHRTTVAGTGIEVLATYLAKGPLLGGAPAHRLLADWLDSGYRGRVISVVCRALAGEQFLPAQIRAGRTQPWVRR